MYSEDGKILKGEKAKDIMNSKLLLNSVEIL